MNKRLCFTLIIMCCLAAFGSNSDELQISFVTCYPGSDIYELEGHSALRIRDGNNDWAVNYGLFDFNSPNFVYRFVKGETDYCVGAIPWQYFLDSYAQQNRTVIERPLRLDSLQRAKVVELVNVQLLPQNRTYRYNYVKDNCSLRPLRLVQSALGDSIILPAPSPELDECKSFRDVMRYYHRNYPWYQFGIDLALGSGIDYKIDNWDKAFAPVALDRQLPGASCQGQNITDPAIVVYQGNDATLPPTPWILSPMAVALLVMAISIMLSIRDMRRHKVTKWFDAAMFGLYGLAGLLLTFLIFVSVHEATSPNWLYLWLNPLCLVVPVCIWLKKLNIIVFSYQIINFALIMTMAVIWPFTGQSGNTAFMPLIAADALRAFNYIYVTLHNKKH